MNSFKHVPGIMIVNTLPVGKSTLCMRFYSARLTKELLRSTTDEAKAQICQAHTECKQYFMNELGMTERTANVYMNLCRSTILDQR